LLFKKPKVFKRIRRQATDWKKIFAKNTHLMKDLSKIYRELLKHTTPLKNGPKTLTDTSPKIIQMAIST